MQMTWELFMGIGGAIVLIGNVGAVIHEWIRPALNTKHRIEEMQNEIESLKQHEKNDMEALRHMQEMDKLQCQAMLCMINHMIDGNNIDKMRETREEIQDLLIRS